MWLFGDWILGITAVGFKRFSFSLRDRFVKKKIMGKDSIGIETG
jgi:hypothetical protein